MRSLIKLLFIFCPLVVFGQQPFSVYLIGDAGEDTVPGKALQLLQQQLLADTNSAVVFLGDNVYPNGLNLKDKNSLLHLESQLQILKQYKGQAYFIPGNHDWNAQRRNGLTRINDQEHFVTDYLKDNSSISNKNKGTFFPGNGLPGPVSVMLNNSTRIIFIDSQWFLHFHKKNKTGSKKNTIALFYTTLDSLLTFSKTNNEKVIITAHHPMFTNGEHSRKLQPLRFFINCTPFQLFGLCGVNRWLSQDLRQGRYRKMKKRLMFSFNKYDNIIYASGHDHNLQCFKEGNNKYIVSGSGSKLSKLRRKKTFLSVFEDDKSTGFVKLEFNGQTVTTTIYRTNEKEKLLLDY
jgi:predicted phosphodiesterase